MKTTNKYGLLLVVLINWMSFANVMYSQKLEDMTNGTFNLTMVVNNKIVHYQSTDLVVELDFQTAQFTMILDPQNIKTGIDSLDKIIRTRKEVFRMVGELGIKHIPIEKHPPLEFEVSARVQDETIGYLEGEGELTYVFNGMYSSILTIVFNTDLKTLGLNDFIPAQFQNVELFIKCPIPNMS